MGSQSCGRGRLGPFVGEVVVERMTIVVTFMELREKKVKLVFGAREQIHAIKSEEERIRKETEKCQTCSGGKEIECPECEGSGYIDCPDCE